MDAANTDTGWSIAGSAPNQSLAYSPTWLQDRPWADGVDLELAYYDVRLDSAIAALDTKLQLDQCVLNADDKACMGIMRGPEGAISAFVHCSTSLDP